MTDKVCRIAPAGFIAISAGDDYGPMWSVAVTVEEAIKKAAVCCYGRADEEYTGHFKPVPASAALVAKRATGWAWAYVDGVAVTVEEANATGRWYIIVANEGQGKYANTLDEMHEIHEGFGTRADADAHANWLDEMQGIVHSVRPASPKEAMEIERDHRGFDLVMPLMDLDELD